jgi:hypothetical protein
MAAGNVTIGAYAGGQDPATLVLDAPIASHLSSGSTGAKINAAGSSADPLANPTSTYATPATVGYVIGHSLGNTGASLAGNVTVGAYAGGEDPATLLLASPANKLATDSTGRVILQPTQTGVTIPTVTTVTNEITASAIASVILSNPSHPLVTDNSGNAQISLTQAIPTTNTPQTTGDSLNAARAQGFGKWQLVGTTLTLFGPDGSTAVRTFTLDSATAPTQRA